MMGTDAIESLDDFGESEAAKEQQPQEPQEKKKDPKDSDLRRMSRLQLIEIIYALQQEQKSLMEENKKLQEKLDERIIKLSQFGSIADAAMGLNEVFEAAQAAADQYVASVRQGYDGIWHEIIGIRDRLKTQLKEGD